MDGAILNKIFIVMLTLRKCIMSIKILSIKNRIERRLCCQLCKETCGDCHYVMPNVIIPYIKEHDIKKNIYLFEFQKYYEAAQNEEDYEAQIEYQELKDQFHLSINSDTFLDIKLVWYRHFTTTVKEKSLMLMSTLTIRLKKLAINILFLSLIILLKE